MDPGVQPSGCETGSILFRYQIDSRTLLQKERHPTGVSFLFCIRIPPAVPVVMILDSTGVEPNTTAAYEKTCISFARLLRSAYNGPHGCFCVLEIMIRSCCHKPNCNRKSMMHHRKRAREGSKGRGGFDCGSKELSPSPEPTSLVTFLFGNKKVTHPLYKCRIPSP